MKAIEEVVKNHFPIHEAVQFKQLRPSKFQLFMKEELWSASKKMKCNKAPGPGSVPPKMLKQVAQFRPEYVLSIYNRLAGRGEDPSSFRPIFLFNGEGKLYEHLIFVRLTKELDRIQTSHGVF